MGALFLLLAAFWAAVALGLFGGRATQAPLNLRVRVLDPDGAEVPEVQVRSRYGGDWLRPAPGTGLVDASRLPLGPRTGSTLEALVDALEVRGAYVAMRRGRRADVLERGDEFEATFRVERCGLLRLALGPTALREVRVVVDADPGAERWRLLEGRDVVRPSEAATWAVFPDADTVGVTLEGDQGVARERRLFPAPGPGFLLEHTLFPLPAAPIGGALHVAEGVLPPTLVGVLEVEELPEGGAPVRHPDVRIGADGRFRVEYAGARRYRLTPRGGFFHTGSGREATGGQDAVEIAVAARPWIEVGPAPLASLESPPDVALFAAAGGSDLLTPGSVLRVPTGLSVAAPRSGRYRLLVLRRGTDEAPPQSGEVEVDVPSQGSVAAEALLEPLPHGTLELTSARVPARGADVTVLPDRRRTWLQGFPGDARVPHLPVGRAFVRVRFNDPAWAVDVLAADVRAGETARLTVRVEPGGRVAFDAQGSALAHSADPWALRLLAGQTPYGTAEGTLDLVREGGTSTFVTVGSLRAGAYQAQVHRRVPSDEPPLPVRFVVTAGSTTRVPLGAP